jgi:D-alanyl-lipoteichoic acid acyltransferase DltB (MBOAT superfamily)
MLFNSYEFIFAFLPVVFLAFLLVKSIGPGYGRLWLVLASFYFYAYWDVTFLPILIGSIGFNYVMGRLIELAKPVNPALKVSVLVVAIAGNIGLLCYFKYVAFFAETLGYLLNLHIASTAPTLPLGISFFTFTQLTYLVDVAYRQAVERDLVRYSLFANFFPHLIAGPILHHAEVIPQFDFRSSPKTMRENLAVGLAIFCFGLFKKVALADGVQPFVAYAFERPAPSLLEAWTGVLAYGLQIYFDFSGYSDMAIGLARMFGIRFPLNFDSPYQAASIIEFWRRWHMTLSRFLRDYLYVPLGGNRGGLGQLPNIFITMFLGGLWHGAGWTFIAWGMLHAAFLAVNHTWRRLRTHMFGNATSASALERAGGWALTFIGVMVAWVFFRSTSLPEAAGVLHGMAGLNGGGSVSTLGCGEAGSSCVAGIPIAWGWIGGLLALALLAPNVQQVMCRWDPTLDRVRSRPRFRLLVFEPSLRWAIFLGILMGLSIACLTPNSQFLYYQF